MFHIAAKTIKMNLEGKATYSLYSMTPKEYKKYSCWTGGGRGGATLSLASSQTQEAKYVESWPNTTSAWAGWSRFEIPVDRYSGVHSLLLCTSITLGSSTCHQASQQENTYWAKYQKADRAITLCTLWARISLEPVLWCYSMTTTFTISISDYIL
jgi:hypothetical protein